MAQSVFIRHRKGRGVYQLCWKEQGRERTKSFKTRHEAEQEKHRRLQLIAQGCTPEPFDGLSTREKRDLFFLHDRAINNGYHLWDAVQTHEKFLSNERPPAVEISEAVAMCLQDKEAEGDSPRTLQSLRSVLYRFAAHCSGKALCDVKTADAVAFVDGMDISLRTRLGYLGDLRTFYSWALKKCLLKNNPINEAMPGKATRRRIMQAKRTRRMEQVLSVEECHLLLNWTEKNDPDLLVYPVLCLFAGLRPEQEATGIDWPSITISHITVDATIAKDGETRIIEPLTPNLVEWIRFIDSKGLNPFPLRNLRRRWDRVKQVLDRKWPDDAMRHSYASYHFAMFGNAGLTAKNLGHPDTTLLRKDYNGAATKVEAGRFWKILPWSGSGNYPCNDLDSLNYPIQYQSEQI